MSQMKSPLQPSTEEAPHLCEHFYNVFIANYLHCDTSMVSAQVLCRNNSVKHVLITASKLVASPRASIAGQSNLLFHPGHI